MGSWLQRATTVLLLCAQVLLGVCAMGFGDTARCECHHGPEVSCDCPHHSGGADASLPPCHRKLLAKKAAEERRRPGIKSHCASSRPELLIPMLAEVPRLQPALELPTETRRIELPLLCARECPRRPQAPPPRDVLADARSA